jgi:parallel beta-helix repeat protein
VRSKFARLGEGRRWAQAGRTLAALGLLAAASARAAVYYVDTKGSDSNSGTLDSPFAGMQKGADKAVAGDTVFLRGGTYTFRGAGANSTAGVYLTKSGTSDSKRICFWAYKNEKPILDFAGVSFASTTSAGIRINGANWLYFKGLEICNVPQPGGAAANNGIWANPTSNTIFEMLDLHNNSGPGLSMANGNGGNLVLNCDSHHNYDPKSNQGDGQNADGFGVHYQKSGPSTVLRGCRAWWNSDDGFDCISQGVAVTVENCWNALNGYKPGTMTSAPSGNGNGFKVGGWGNPPDGYPTPVPTHTIRNCLAFLNKAAGIYTNHQPGDNYFYNNTAYNNHAAGFNMLGYDLNKKADAGRGIYRNNISFSNTATSNGNGADASNNSWDMSGLTVAESDFESLDTAGVFGPRKADGSLPDIKFMHLSANSKLIAKGKDVGIAFQGAAPDLGAFPHGNSVAIRKVPEASRAAGKNGITDAELFDYSGRKLDKAGIHRAIIPVKR